MVRSGSFSRDEQMYGMALGAVKPPDNNPGSIIPPELQDPALKLTEEQKLDLAQRIQDLYDMYRGQRDFF